MRLTLPIQRRAAILLLVLAAFDFAILAAQEAGLRINTTASMPLGLYRLRPQGNDELSRGSFIAICPSAKVLAVAIPRHYLHRGLCPGDVEPLLKSVGALPGDRVNVSDDAVLVNGHALPNSGRVARDCQGRPLLRIPAGAYVVPARNLWLYAPVARSWDSRYFGPEPDSNVIGIATPILLVGEGRTCA